MNKNDEESEKLVTIQLPKKSKGIMVGGCISKHGLGKLIFFIGAVDSFGYRQSLEFYKQDIEALSEGNSLLYSNKITQHHIIQNKQEKLKFYLRAGFGEVKKIDNYYTDVEPKRFIILDINYIEIKKGNKFILFLLKNY